MIVLFSQRAEDDLARIYGYIAGRNPDAAERFKSEAENALSLVGGNPELGTPDPVADRLSNPPITGLSVRSQRQPPQNSAGWSARDIQILGGAVSML